MPLDNGLSHREPQADAAGGAIARFINPIVGTEDVIEGIRGYAGSAVPDGHDQCRFFTGQFNFRGLSVFCGVVDQIGEGALQAQRSTPIHGVCRPGIADIDVLIGVIIRNGE